MNRFVVLDLETTGNSSTNQDKIIEVGMVVVENDEIVDEFSTLLYPGKSIPPFITKLTGIEDDDVKEAPTFNEMADTIVEILENSYLIAHNVPFDLGFLNSELTAIGKARLSNPVIDTVELTRILYPQAPGFKLGILAEYLNITHDHPHRALSDAFVTAKLFLKLKQKITTLPYETVEHLLKLEKVLKSDLYELLTQHKNALAFSADKQPDKFTTFNGLTFLNQVPSKRESITVHSSFGEYLDGIYEENGTMESQMTKYEKRDGQRTMSEDIYDAFQAKNHALIEAETGTGKSLAYLIPAIYEAVKTNKKIVISTYTTQLQSQLLEEEIPLIRKLVAFPFQVTLLKGKQHYISIEKFTNELYSNQQDNYDIALTKAMILIWLLETETGDIDELHLPSHGQIFYKRISADTEGQADPASPWFKYSYYQKARRRAQLSDVIITNHALLCTDMFNDYQFLPSYDKAIIDEAHHLEETASKHYGLKLDYVNMQHVFNQFGAFGEGKWIDKLQLDTTDGDTFSKERWNDLLSLTKYELDDLFRTIFQYVLDQEGTSKVLSDIGRIQYRFDHKKEKVKSWNVVKEMATRLIFYIRDLIHLLTIMDQMLTDKDMKDEAEHRIELLQSFIDGMEQLFLMETDQLDVKWIEIEAYGAKNAVYLYSEPVNVSSILEEKFFNMKESIILTSATLTMKNSFSFIQKRLGLPKDRLYTQKIPSPFSYQEQVRVMVPSDFPELNYGNTDDFIAATCEAILSLAEITNGRMLVLFTSYDMLKKSYYLLKEIMENDKFILIAQGISSGSRERLKKNFQTFDQSILLGTSSFWEGVDIPGDDLSCLMIVRLPFQPPNHPVYEAKALDMKNKGANAFYDLALPNAVIRFKQGFGRLIRSTNDRGIVFVCDARIIKSSYGKYFTESIPKIPIAFDSTSELMEKAKNWF